MGFRATRKCTTNDFHGCLFIKPLRPKANPSERRDDICPERICARSAAPAARRRIHPPPLPPTVIINVVVISVSVPRHVARRRRRRRRRRSTPDDLPSDNRDRRGSNGRGVISRHRTVITIVIAIFVRLVLSSC